MSDVQELALVAIYSEESGATRNFDAIIELTNDPLDSSFDAAVAVKGTDGAVSIVREHRTREDSHTRRGSQFGGAAGLLAMLIPGVGAAAALNSLLAGALIGGAAESRSANADRTSFKQTADNAIDVGEALLAVVCPADAARKYDDLLTNARLVLRFNLDEVS